MFNNVCYLLLKCILSMGKEKKDGNADAGSRQKYKTWSDDSTEFMLQWYIDYLKEKPATSTWKQHHHHMCAEALNARFGLGATTQQVDRHFRAFKEKWNWIKLAMDKSGYGFDAGSCKFNIHYSEKSPSKLGPGKYNYLTRPIKIFHLIEELFGESAKANRSLAVDQCTVDAEDDNNRSGSDEVYTPEHDENDSDTIAPRCPPLVGSSFSIKRKNKKSPGKKHVKDKAKHARATGDDEIATSIAMFAKSIASSCPATTDPYADLWKRIEDIPFPLRDKVDIATYLSKPEQVHLRNYLNAASD
ncbi:uncharacterized protein [Miscanthus floridulus]|uniref:uncharacterized protein isoform X1 n=2 Tax=Miscanthus floridulus TaxID=154761 RepID=UPI003459BBA9